MRRLLLACVLAIPMLTVAAAPAAADDASQAAYPSGVNARGASYAVWAQRWLTWAFATPEGTNPLAHPGNCSTNQHGDVWYMPQTSIGTSATARCTVQRGSAILLSPGGSTCDNSDLYENSAFALKACARSSYGQLYNLRVWIDGVELTNFEPFETETHIHRVRYPANNILGVRPGTYWSVGKGVFVLLRPLSSGRHTIVVSDQSDEGTARVTAFLTVR